MMKKLALLVLLCGAACSDDDDSEERRNTSRNISFEVFCDEQAQAVCGRVSGCDFEVPWFYRRSSDCAGDVKADCLHQPMWRNAFAEVEAERLRVDDAAFGACLSRLSSSAC